MVASALDDVRPERTTIVCEWVLSSGRFNQPIFKPDDAIELGTRITNRLGTCAELSQQGIASRAYARAVYSSRRKYYGGVGQVLS